MFILLLLFAPTLSAANVQNATVKFSLRNATVMKVLQAIESQTDFLFVYDKNEVDVDRTVDMTAGNKTVENMLTEMFAGTNVVYHVKGVSIVLAVQGQSQQTKGIPVSGTVTDDQGMGLPGVTIIIKGTSIGVITDMNGNYKVADAPSNGTLVFSSIGFASQEIPISGKSVINVGMKEESIGLNEVVAIGYGTAKRKDLTGSVSTVDLEQLKDIPATSALQSIAGRMAGVNVTVTEGSPDAEIKIRVRGGSSITQDNSPLYIVDGFQVKSINDIPPGDIESIDVLKDASSTAIYGSQGANGVILVTTKSGREGKSEISFNSYIGFKKVYNLTDVLSPYEFVYYQRELDPGASVTGTAFFGNYGTWEDLDIYKSKKGTDWQDELFGHTGLQQNYNISLSGGDKSLRYNLSYTRDDEDFIMLNSEYKRDNVNLRLTKEFGKKLTIDFSSRTTNTNVSGPSVSSGKKLRDAIKYAPVFSLSYVPLDAIGSDEDVTSAETLSALNDPIYNTVNEYKEQYQFSSVFNVGLTWKIMKGLSYSSKGSYGYRKDQTDNIWLKNTGQASSNGGQPVAERTFYLGDSWSFQNTLNYNFNVDDVHDFKLLAGQEIYHSQVDQTYLQSKFFPEDFTANDVLAMWNYGTAQPTYTTIGEPSRTSSFFGRVNYSLLDRYILTVTTRADGKNVFAPGNQWGIFPGAAFAWRLSDEPFMAGFSHWLSNAKLRLSYGEVGNARVSSYWRQEYSFQTASNKLIYLGEAAQSSLQTSSVLKNENLTWESKISTNLGLDLGFFNQRLSLTIDAYNDITNNLILAVALPSNSGYTTQYQNMGQTSNRGLEISATGYIIDKPGFKLSTNFNIAFNRNKIEELDGSDQLIASSGWGIGVGSDDYRAIVGQPVGLIYGYKSDGMYTFDDFTFNPTSKKWDLNEGVVDASSVITTSGSYFGPGHMKLKKLKGDGTLISPDEDRTVIGNAQPKHTGGFSVNAVYKGFDLSAMFNWSYGNDIYNANKIDNTTYVGSKKYQNLSTEMSLANRFTTIDPTTGYNIMYGDYANPELLQQINQDAQIWHPLNNSSILTDWAVEDGSFLRLSNISLGYTLPSNLSKKILMQKLRFYVNANNVWIWTKYTGQDPEVDTRRSTPLTPGVDYSAYPKAKALLFGVNVTF
ncbi:MAG: TonB-dependent receptor [Breznakibacter sp.]